MFCIEKYMLAEKYKNSSKRRYQVSQVTLKIISDILYVKLYCECHRPFPT